MKSGVSKTASIAAVQILGLVAFATPAWASVLPCRQTVEVVSRNGTPAFRAVNGLFLRTTFLVSWCASNSLTEKSAQRKFVASGSETYYWHNGELQSLLERNERIRKNPGASAPDIRINVYIDVNSVMPFMSHARPFGWWWSPALPHQKYPLDLLPNFGLKDPTSSTVNEPLVNGSRAYWAVRGTKNAFDGRPFVTSCSFQISSEAKSPTDPLENSPARLTKRITYERDLSGNTCRGNIAADSGKPLYAMVDIPGAAVAQIDVIYQKLASRLSTFVLE